MKEPMTQEQIFAEIMAARAKSCIDQDARLDDISKDVQKEWIDMGKDLFVNHDKAKAWLHATKIVDLLSRRNR